MSFFSFLERKVSRAWALHMVGPRAPAWSNRNYLAFSREAYQLNVIAYSAIQRIQNSVSSVEWVPYRDDKKLEASPFTDLLKKPNPAQIGSAWWRTRIGYLMLSGNLYDEKVRGPRGRPLELWPLRPDRMSIIKSQTGLPAGYEYRVGQEVTTYPADPVSGDSDILHTKLFHPTDDWYGMSPIEAAAYSVDQHNETANWIQSLLQNAARPSGALIVDKETNLTDDEFKRLKKEVEEKYAGAENAGRPMLLEGGMDWKAMGLSPMDMEILRTKESAARDISLAFGVPPLLLNIPGDNTYANYREARLGFYEDTILPLVRFIANSLNDWLSEDFDGVRVRPDIDKIEAIADKRTKMWEMADNSDDITLNESRAMKGLEPLPEPLGSTLMVEVRKLGQPDPAPAATEQVMKELAFGTRS